MENNLSAFLKLISNSRAALALIAMLAVACNRAEFLPRVEQDFDSRIDFGKSQIQVTSPVPADGISASTIVLFLLNKDGQPIVGLQPQIMASGTGNIYVPCTISDATGKSTCSLISTVAGDKEVWPVGGQHVAVDIVFTRPPPSKTLFGVVAGGTLQTLPTGHKIVAASGIVETEIQVKDLNGIKRLRSSQLGTIITEP